MKVVLLSASLFLIAGATVAQDSRHTNIIAPEALA